MSEQRTHSRLAYETDIVIVTEDQKEHTGRMVNLSRGGALVQVSCSLDYGSKVTLCFNLPGIPDKCEIPCITRWIKSEHGTGLQFKQLRPIEVWALNKLMHTLTD